MESFRLVARTSDSSTDAGRQGTAWLLWPDLAVTALHVVGEPGGAGQWLHDKLKDPKGAYTLRPPGGEPVPLAPLLYDPKADLAVLRIPSNKAFSEDAFSVLAAMSPAVGEPWHAVGYPAFETSGRAISVGGIVSHVTSELASTAMQLFVDQGTSVTWGGISGCAAQNGWGEVIAVVCQTVSGIATCNAAPVEAVARLVGLLQTQERVAAELGVRLGALGDKAMLDVLGAMRWAVLAGKEEFTKDPVKAVAERIAQAGAQGLRLALDAIEGLEASASSAAGASAGEPAAVMRTAAASSSAAPAAASGSAASDFLAQIAGGGSAERPSSRDLLDVLDALADAGGTASAGDLQASLPSMPKAVFFAASDALLDRRLRSGTRGPGASLVLTEDGAQRAARKDYVRAVLRALLARDAVSEADLLQKAGIGPRALHRAIVYASTLRLLSKRPGNMFSITDDGRAFYARRATDAAAPIKRAEA